MNLEAMFKLSYGMYVISTEYNGKKNGMIGNVGGMLTDNPVRLGICLNKKNLTTELIQKKKAFTLAVLSEDAPLTYIGKFGFHSGRDTEKFEGTNHINGDFTGLPIPTDYALSYMEAEVEQEIEIGGYIFFIGKVGNAEVLDKESKPMTYSYYHDIKGGFTSKNAPTYVAPDATKKEKGEAMKKYRCMVCGYIYDPEKGDPDSGIKPGTAFEDIPADWKCPVCGVGKDQFEAVA